MKFQCNRVYDLTHLHWWCYSPVYLKNGVFITLQWLYKINTHTKVGPSKRFKISNVPLVKRTPPIALQIPINQKQVKFRLWPWFSRLWVIELFLYSMGWLLWILVRTFSTSSGKTFFELPICIQSWKFQTKPKLNPINKCCLLHVLWWTICELEIKIFTRYHSINYYMNK